MGGRCRGIRPVISGNAPADFKGSRRAQATGCLGGDGETRRGSGAQSGTCRGRCGGDGREAVAALSVPLPGLGTPTSTPPPMTLWPPAARPAWPSAWLPCRNLPSLQPTWPGCGVTRPGHHARGAKVLLTRLPPAPQADPRPTQRSNAQRFSLGVPSDFLRPGS